MINWRTGRIIDPLVFAAVWWHHTHTCGEDRIHWAVSARIPPPSVQGPFISQTVSWCVSAQVYNIHVSVWITTNQCCMFVWIRFCLSMQSQWKTQLHRSRCGKPAWRRDGSSGGMVMDLKSRNMQHGKKHVKLIDSRVNGHLTLT